MLQVENLRFRYGSDNPLLHFPDLSVGAGDSLLLLGESGCGKTTFLNLLAGLLRPESGSVRIGSTDLSALSDARLDRFRGEHIGLIYQQSYFLDALTAGENLLLSPFGRDKQRAASLSHDLGIAPLLRKYPRQLSTGERQRLTIARALMGKPKVLLADEPTSALDDGNTDRVVELLVDAARTAKAALLIVTHDNRLRRQFDNFIELSPQTQ